MSYSPSFLVKELSVECLWHGEKIIVEFTRNNVRQPWEVSIFQKAAPGKGRFWSKVVSGFSMFSEGYLPTQEEIDNTVNALIKSL